jgi:hypothetical protein
MLESATTPGKELRRRVPTVVVASTPHPAAAPLCQGEGQRAEGERRGSERRAVWGGEGKKRRGAALEGR